MNEGSTTGRGVSHPVNWSGKFNALPIEVRTIGAALSSQQRIQHLNFEKARLKRRYRESLAEINLHIKNCEEHLARLEKEVQ